MDAPEFIVAEEKSPTLLTLIVDKKGIFGPSLLEQIHQDITTVLVTAKAVSQSSTIIIPYTKTIPEIPEGEYQHIFFVWDGTVETLHLLPPLLQKAAADKAQFVFVADFRFYTEKLVRYIHQDYAKASIIFIGDVFGVTHYASAVANMLTNAQAKGVIVLENVGLRHVFPVFFEDVVKKIVTVGFGTDKGKIFLAYQSHGMTELSLAHLLQKIEPLIKIDFVKKNREERILPEGDYLFDETYDVARKIQEVYTDMSLSKNTAAKNENMFFSPLALQKQKLTEKKKRKFWIVGIVIAFLLILSPILLALFYGGLGGLVAYEAGREIKAGKYEEAVSFATTSHSLFSAALSVNQVATQELQIAFLTNVSKQLTHALETGSLVSSLLRDAGSASENFSLVAKGNSLSPQADFLLGIDAVKSASITLQNAPADISLGNLSAKQLVERMQPFANMLDSAPSLLGFPSKKTYMVLLQNNMELRPGGGFIGSYALITLDKGRVVDLSIHDVYDADGQLKGHIEPPYVIRRYIPEQHWFLRDSNFDVDFSQDAANAALFLQQETGQQVDGVVGVDLTFVKDILLGIGPVYVAGYNQTVTAQNFFLLTESHAEKNSFAGSTQKKDFLNALFLAMQQQLTSRHGFSADALLPILSSVQSKDIVFGFSDPLFQDLFTINGLSDSLWDTRGADSTTIVDTTGLNEANIGVNKANYFVTRSVSQAVIVANTGSVSGQLTITYANASEKGIWPGGPYKNYLRFILPLGAKLQAITINGKAQAITPAITDASVYEKAGFAPPSGLEVDSTVEKGKQLYGFVVTVPEGQTQKIIVSYALSQAVDVTKPILTYSGFLIKQPGVDTYPYTFSLTMPSQFSLLQKPSWMKGSGNSISTTMSFGEDRHFSVQFTQK